MKYFKYILTIVLLVAVIFLAVSFTFMNADPVKLSLLPSVEVEQSLALIIFISFVVGLLVGALLVSFSLIGQKLKTGKANRQLKKVEKEVEGLRAAPVDQA